jgi:hypothetical protein
MASDWQELVFLATDQLFTETLGPAIRDDAKALCPVFFGENSTAGETSRQIAESLGTPMPGGALRDSIEDHLDGHDLIVAATGNGERTYAYWVEMGHRIVVFSYDTGREKPESPFLRPALYQIRGMAA